MTKQKNSIEKIRKYSKEFSEKLQEKKEAKTRVKSELERLQRDLEEAKEKIDEAVISGNNESFKEWSDQRNFCELRIGYLKEQLPLIMQNSEAKEASNNFARTVIKTANEIDIENQRKASLLLQELKALMDDSDEIQTEVNSMLGAYSQNIGNITLARCPLGGYVDSLLVRLKYNLERDRNYKSILEGNIPENMRL